MKLFPDYDIDRHLALFRLTALFGLLLVLLVVGRNPDESALLADPEEPRAQHQSAIEVMATRPAPAASTDTLTAAEDSPRGMPANPPTPAEPRESKPPSEEPTAQDGALAEGLRLPALDLEMDAETFRWLVDQGEALLLARSSEGKLWKLRPDARRGFDEIRLASYLPRDALGLSTRNVPIHAANPWVELDTLQRQVSRRIGGLDSVTFELRLGNALDARLAQRQMEELARRGFSDRDTSSQSETVKIELSVRTSRLVITTTSLSPDKLAYEKTGYLE